MIDGGVYDGGEGEDGIQATEKMVDGIKKGQNFANKVPQINQSIGNTTVRCTLCDEVVASLPTADSFEETPSLSASRSTRPT